MEMYEIGWDIHICPTLLVLTRARQLLPKTPSDDKHDNISLIYLILIYLIHLFTFGLATS
jgi:hypothetical protein